MTLALSPWTVESEKGLRASPGRTESESESEPASESALLKATDTAQGDHVDLQITEKRGDGGNSFLSRNTINRREH